MVDDRFWNEVFDFTILALSLYFFAFDVVRHATTVLRKFIQKFNLSRVIGIVLESQLLTNVRSSLRFSDFGKKAIKSLAAFQHFLAAFFAKIQ